MPVVLYHAAARVLVDRLRSLSHQFMDGTVCLSGAAAIGGVHDQSLVHAALAGAAIILGDIVLSLRPHVSDGRGEPDPPVRCSLSSYAQRERPSTRRRPDGRMVLGRSDRRHGRGDRGRMPLPGRRPQPGRSDHFHRLGLVQPRVVCGDVARRGATAAAARRRTLSHWLPRPANDQGATADLHGGRFVAVRALLDDVCDLELGESVKFSLGNLGGFPGTVVRKMGTKRGFASSTLQRRTETNSSSISTLPVSATRFRT